MNRSLVPRLLCVAIALIAVSRPTPGDEPPPGDERGPNARLEFMMDTLRGYSVRVGGDNAIASPALLPQPALRWTNTVSGTKDGIVGVWSRGGRPDVVVQFSGPYTLYNGAQGWSYHFCSTSLEPLAMERAGRTVWAPKAGGVTLQVVSNAPAPATTATKRLVQMRQIAGRFEVIDDFHPVYGQPKIERTKLRMLSRPLYRYGASSELIDRALFGLVIATDPEALLMVEAHETKAGREWRYGLARMTVYRLTARLDGVEVWEVPERLPEAWQSDGPCFVGMHR